MKIILRSLIVSSLCLSLSAYAETKIGFNDNDILSLSVSQNNINKIFFPEDAIIDLHAPEGYLTTSNDNDGALYFQMNSTRSMTVYLSTEQGHHVGLTLKPITSNGQTLAFIPKTASPIAKQWEEKKSYEGSLLALMRAMLKGVAPQGYGTEDGSTHQAIYLEDLKLLPTVLYNGSHFTGIVYKLCNETDQPIHLEERDFFREGVLAVSLSTTSEGQWVNIIERAAP